jgi:2'-5' RNA ligase
VAVEPPPALVEALRSIDRPDRRGLRWTPPDQWHITLRFLAAVDPDALVSALAGLSWTEPVDAVAGPGPVPLSRRVWMLPVAGLEGLAGAVTAVTASLAEVEDRPFRGHLTLARAQDPRALRALPAPEVATRWAVQEVVAFHSELLRGGARHRVLGRFPVGSG